MESALKRTTRACALAAALMLVVAAPAAADPLGDQFKVSDHSTSGEGEKPDIAYNSVTGEHLAVWTGSEGFLTGVSAQGVFAQRLAADGSRVGPMLKISNDQDADEAAVAFNPEDNDWAVIWNSDGNVRGQLVDADGGEVGPDDFQVDDEDGNIEGVDIAYSGAAREYMTVWSGAGNSAWAHRLGADGNEIGDDIDLIDVLGSVSDDTPAIAYNPVQREYLANWIGEEGSKLGELNTRQIWGQRLGLDGSELGDEFEVSNHTPDEYASGPRVAANTLSGDYMVTWRIDDDSGANADEVWAQRLTGGGSEIGGEFAVTDSGGQPANRADIAYNPCANEYVTTWHRATQIVNGAELLGGGGSREEEIFGQRLAADGSFVGTRQFQLSEMQPDGDNDYRGLRPAVAYNSQTSDYMAVWWGTNQTGEPEDEQNQIWGRRIAAPACAPPPGPTAAPVPAAAPAPARPARPRVSVAGVRRACIRTRSRVSVRIRLGTGATLRSARVTLDGRRLTTSRRTRFSVTINARRLRPGRHRLRIVVTDSAGNRRTVSRTIRVCAAQRRRAAPRFTG